MVPLRQCYWDTKWGPKQNVPYGPNLLRRVFLGMEIRHWEAVKLRKQEAESQTPAQGVSPVFHWLWPQAQGHTVLFSVRALHKAKRGTWLGSACPSVCAELVFLYSRQPTLSRRLHLFRPQQLQLPLKGNRMPSLAPGISVAGPWTCAIWAQALR